MPLAADDQPQDSQSALTEGLASSRSANTLPYRPPATGRQIELPFRTDRTSLRIARATALLAAVVVFLLGMRLHPYDRPPYRTALWIILDLYVVLAAISAACRWRWIPAFILIGLPIAFFYQVNIECLWTGSWGPHGFDACTETTILVILLALIWAWWHLSQIDWPTTTVTLQPGLRQRLLNLRRRL